MITAIAATTSIGTVSYLWLTVSALPITRALRATVHARRGSGWRYALPLALGVAMMTAAIACAAAIVTTILAPAIAPHLGDRITVVTGLLAGAVVWCARAAGLGAPRLSADLEIALALALVALKSDDPALLSMVERQYAHHVLLTPGSEYVTHAARTVLTV